MTRAPSLILRPTLLAVGHTDAELHRLRRSGDLVTVRGGAYLERGDPALERAEDRHRALVQSTLGKLGPPGVVSHVSAAVVHRLRVWNVPLDRVHVTRDGSSGGRISGRLHLHRSSLGADDVVEVDGIAVTSLARTVLDLALNLPFEPALVVADSAFERSPAPELWSEVAARLAGRRGAASARRVLSFADSGSRSAGESRSRLAVFRSRLPKPVLQWRVRTAGGAFIGDTDFGWPDSRTVGEFDGLVKYGRTLLKPGQAPADVVVAEKIREDALRDQGLGVVRWTWSDLTAFEPVAERLWRSFARAR